MNRQIRQAWTKLIRAEDYDAHMAAIGQAEANADLVVELFRDHAPPAGAAILFVGAGTGQLFDYAPAAVLQRFQITFSDINPDYLSRLSARIATSEVKFQTIADDVENSKLTSKFDLVIAILVLEHVNWRKAVATICRRSTARIFVVLQENPAGLTNTANPQRLKGSMRVFTKIKRAPLDQSEVQSEFSKQGFELRRSSWRKVLDGKTMVGLEFHKSR